jgi:beta-glucosidase/6-phospho-beta-glucosidase/beta-galactosidase
MTKSSPAPLLPADFHFGVATAGFQIEGGYNGPGEPSNNWAPWERAGRIEPSGVAVDFWNRYPEHLDRVAALGCDSFRLSIEWARIETEDGQIDDGAIAHYRSILDACHDRGLLALVTLHHFTHPEWLGIDYWLRPDAPGRFGEWVRLAVEQFGDRCTNWITTNECNIYAVQSYLTGDFPPGRIGALDATITALDHLVSAHVLAYDAIHDAQPGATVATNNYALSIYELDRLPTDLLLAKDHGVGRAELGAWLAGRRADHYRVAGTPPGVSHNVIERALRALAARRLPLERALPRTVAAVYASPSVRLLDVAQLDYYAPETGSHFRAPGRRTAGGRISVPARPLWDDPPTPEGLTRAVEVAGADGLDVWVVENGICNRVLRGRSHPRGDGWTRDRYLRENLEALVVARQGGAPVAGYWHWTLIDNYEWGSYEPRFGIYGVDRERGIRVLETDAMGVDAAGAYRSLIAGIRAGDAGVFDAPSPAPSGWVA